MRYDISKGCCQDCDTRKKDRKHQNTALTGLKRYAKTAFFDAFPVFCAHVSDAEFQYQTSV